MEKLFKRISNFAAKSFKTKVKIPAFLYYLCKTSIHHVHKLIKASTGKIHRQLVEEVRITQTQVSSILKRKA